MDREKFHLLVRDLLANIHDPAVLEKHAANSLVPLSERAASRAENLRHWIHDGIESLKPMERPVNVETLEWRFYLVLYYRYVEGESFTDVQKRLALGERQVRRLHGRALDALEIILWNRLYPPEATPAAPEEQDLEETNDVDTSYPVQLEPLQIDRVVQEVAGLCLPRIRAQGGDLELKIPPDLPLIQADRVILRQILLDLLNRVLQIWEKARILLALRPDTGTVVIAIETTANLASWTAEKQSADDGPFPYWVGRLHARLTSDFVEEAPGDQHPPLGRQSGLVRFILELPRANQATIYVVDDHEPAIRIIQRYLSHSNVQVIGITDPTQVLTLAKNTRPQVILLDVMMPAIDGWEILQKLKADPETQQIAVVICSVWDQPELAFSLGANGFLKKPINQAELIDELARLGSLGSAGGSRSTGA